MIMHKSIQKMICQDYLIHGETSKNRKFSWKNWTTDVYWDPELDEEEEDDEEQDEVYVEN